MNELVLDADGQKMSKSRGNVVNPWDMIQEFGADTVRLYLLASSQVWLPKRFDRRTIPEVAGGFVNTLRNTYKFFADLCRGMDARPQSPPRETPAAGGPLAAEPAGCHGRGGRGGLGGVRSHGRRPGHHGLRG